MEDNTLTLDTQEMAQEQLVYITNLENDQQNYSTKMKAEQEPKDKKPTVRNRPLERPSLINLNHGSKMHEQLGCENDYVEENEKGENKKNTKELAYTNIGSYKRGEWVEQYNIEKPKNYHEIPRNKKKKLLSPRK